MDDFEQLDHYAILGVGRDASADEIKRAYRQQMARYHPDRFAGAPAEEQAYASRRALRINAAYAALSDFHERAAYNRSLGGPQADAPRPAGRAPTPPPAPRDHLAELYDQAQAHLAAGRALQAAATLREILQLNPFYRDSAALLAQAEAAARPQGRAPVSAAPDRGRRALVAGGLGALALAGLGAIGWAVRGRSAGATGGPPAGGGAAGGAEAQVATAPPASTGAPPEVATPAPATATPAPATATPAPATATPAPPTAPPSPSPVPASPTVAAIPEDGPVLYAEDFSTGAGWPSLSGRGWSVGAVGGAYQIVAAAEAGNIWAYNTAPAADFLVGVDVVATGGLAGLLLRFSEAGYLAFLVNPGLGSYRLVRRDGAGDEVLIEEGNSAITVGPGAANRLAARLAGEALALRINGQPVYDLVLSAPPPSSRYGLVAAADSGEVTATFTNLTLRGI